MKPHISFVVFADHHHHHCQSGKQSGRGGAKDGPKKTDSTEEERGRKLCQGEEVTGKIPNYSSVQPCLFLPICLFVFLPFCLPTCLPIQVRSDPAEGKDGSSELSAHNTPSPSTRQRPDLLLRQHSMPASTTSGDADSYKVYRGLIAGANQGNICFLPFMCQRYFI